MQLQQTSAVRRAIAAAVATIAIAATLAPAPSAAQPPPEKPPATRDAQGWGMVTPEGWNAAMFYRAVRYAALVEADAAAERRRRAAEAAERQRQAVASTTVPGRTPRPVGACGGWEGLVATHFPASQVGNACRVLVCESQGNPNAKNPRSTASGLAQFLDGTWRRARTMVPGAERYSRAMHAPPATQIAVYGAWWRATSWSQWECATMLGIR